MSTEIRAITPDEAADYLRVLPFANGLPSWEPSPAAWYGGPEPWPAPPPPASAAQLASYAEEVMADGVHPVAAFVDGRLVGASAMIEFEVTVPGEIGVPMGGVTSTAVIATHRRRGLLRSMMRHMVDGARERGESLAMLSASEGSIYGRFGFSPATTRVRWEIDRGQAGFAPAPAPAGELELVDAAAARSAWPAVHDAVRRRSVGELSARPGQWDGLSDNSLGSDGPMRYVLHRGDDGEVDGVANYRLPWGRTAGDAGTVVVDALQATTPDAYRALWQLLLDVDLTRRVVAAGGPQDEPLRWMLSNPRALRITRQSDNLWLRLLDLPVALAQRRYEVQDVLTLRVVDDPMCPDNEGTWRLDATTSEASCTRVDSEPDLAIDIHALATLYLGGGSAQLLAFAGRIEPNRDDAVGRLSRLFRIDPEPFNSFGF